MVDQAESDNHKARVMFNFALKVEEVHAGLYTKALEAAKQGEDLAESEVYLCPVCGHIELGEPPASCPVCGTKGERYVQV
jgi:rubrerythrin